MKRINWPDHLVNLIVVILGISIAFYMEGWRSDQKSKQLEAQYLDNLIEDLRHDNEYIDTLISIDHEKLKSLQIVSGATIGRPYNEDSLLNHVFAIQYSPPFRTQKATYESLKTSGNIDVINEFALRNRIIELYEQYYSAAQEFDEAVTDHNKRFIQPYFIKNMEFVSRNKINPDFLNDKELRNMLFAYQNILTLRLDFYEVLQTELEILITEVKKQVK
ncbi:MAG: DUF6090 family protein [Cyclobacteriaceae bacterium]